MTKKNFENLGLDKFKESQVVNEVLNTMGGERTFTKTGDPDPWRGADWEDDRTMSSSQPFDFEITHVYDDPPLV